MRFRVVWARECFTQLDGVIAGGVDVEPLKNAVRLVADELAVDPAGKGRAIAEGLRRLDAPPLRVYFHIETEDQVVIVDSVARWK